MVLSDARKRMEEAKKEAKKERIMVWRPEGWNNPYPDGTEKVLTEKHIIQAIEYPQSNYELFEAGAEAMLDALKKEAMKFNGENLQIVTHLDWGYPEIIRDTRLSPCASGYLVFIPDEE